MGALKKVFHDIGDGIKKAFEGIVKAVEAAAHAFVGAFKALYDATLALAKAIESGNFKAIAESLLKLGAAIATLVQPELLALQVGAAAVMDTLKQTIQAAAKACGLENKPWMQKTMGMLSQATNFTSIGSAATAIGTELTANLNGQKGPLQSTWESTTHTDKNDIDAKKKPETETSGHIG